MRLTAKPQLEHTVFVGIWSVISHRKMTKAFAFIFVLVVVMTACREPIPTDIGTTVRGTVIDSVKNKPLENAKVVLYGCNQTFTGVYCTTPLDSTRTNQKGEFEIAFATEGQSIDYEVEVVHDENYVNSTRQRVQAGQTNRVELKARELNLLRATIKVVSNPADSLIIGTFYGKPSVLYGSSIDTVLYLKVLPTAANYVIYTLWDTRTGRDRGTIDTVQTTLADTTLYEKVIQNIFDLPIR